LLHQKNLRIATSEVTTWTLHTRLPVKRVGRENLSVCDDLNARKITSCTGLLEERVC